MGSPASPLHRGRSILETRVPSTTEDSRPSPIQSQVDGLVGSFTQQATDWRALAAMTAGGLAYRAGRIGILGLGNGPGLRALSVGAGLTAEVSTFEIGHRSLSGLAPQANHPQANLWHWNGSGGLREGLLHSFVTFGTLKAGGRFARGENVVAQHLLQDSAMVLGHQASGALGITPRPTGNLAEQFLHAEATNLQIGAGMALVHGMTPRMVALERGLDLSVRLTPSPLSLSLEGEGGRRSGEGDLTRRFGLGFATAGDARAQETRGSASQEEVVRGPQILMMASEGDPKGPPERRAPPRRSISSVIRRVLGISDQQEMRQILMALHSSLTGPAQRIMLEALQDLENGRPVSPIIQKILREPKYRNAAFLSDEIQRDIEQRLEVLATPESPAHSDSPASLNRIRPTLLGFKRMAAKEGVSPQDLAKILNSLNYPQIDLSIYASYRGEPIYISGDEDAALLQRYAKLNYQSFGEVLFFIRRDLARNFNRAEAAEGLQISADEYALLEENRIRPTPEHIDRIVQTYPIHRGLLEKIVEETRYGESASEEADGPSAPVPPAGAGPPASPASGSHSPLPVPNLSTETIFDLNAQRMMQLARMLQNPENMWAFSATEGVHEALGLAIYFEGIVRNIKQKAVRDHLTGMLNRAGLDEITPRLEARLTAEHRRRKDNGKTDWVLMVDIDHFKRVNDTYLHQNGDKVLAEVSKLIRRHAGRLDDRTARFGGEEFFVWLCESGEEGALRVAETIRSQVEATPIQINGFDPIRVTVSIGVAEMQALPHPDKPGELITEGSLENGIDRADKALYASKRAGRNRVTLFDDTLGKIVEGQPDLFGNTGEER